MSKDSRMRRSGRTRPQPPQLIGDRDMPQSFVNIGASEKTVQEAHKAIVDILKLARADKVAVVALRALKAACTVNNTTIHNCTFTGK